jgi:7-cyano-7-deazaguanine synthase
VSKKKEIAVVLVSGGMDSAVVAAIANEEYEQLGFLHLDYGQKTNTKERECFDKLASHYNIEKKLIKIVDMKFLQQIGGSSLTDTEINVTDFEGDSDEIPSSYVPFRNTHIVAMAVSWAEVIGATIIFIGANEEDSPGYPDCRQEYYDAYNLLIQKGTKDGVIKIQTPIIKMQKTEIIKKSQELSVPLEMTWSCYAKIDKACGVCDSCALRKRAFEKLGIKDPIEYCS